MRSKKIKQSRKRKSRKERNKRFTRTIEKRTNRKKKKRIQKKRTQKKTRKKKTRKRKMKGGASEPQFALPERKSLINIPIVKGYRMDLKKYNLGKVFPWAFPMRFEELKSDKLNQVYAGTLVHVMISNEEFKAFNVPSRAYFPEWGGIMYGIISEVQPELKIRIWKPPLNQTSSRAGNINEDDWTKPSLQEATLTHLRHNLFSLNFVNYGTKHGGPVLGNFEYRNLNASISIRPISSPYSKLPITGPPWVSLKWSKLIPNSLCLR